MTKITTGPCITVQGLAQEVYEAVDGLNGTTPSIVIGTVDSVAFGQPPTVTATTVSNVVTLDFEIPAGDTGGVDGDDGVTPTAVLGTVGTVADGANPTVTDSDGGPNLTLDFDLSPGVSPSVGTVSTLAAGASATVVNSGVDPAVVLDFGIPRGATGATGDGGTLVPEIVVRLAGNIGGPSFTPAVLKGGYHTSDETEWPEVYDAATVVYDTEGFADWGLSGQKWRAAYDDSSGFWEMLHELTSLKAIKATVVTTAFSSESASFTCDTLLVANGRLPVDAAGVNLTSVSVDNSVAKTSGVAGDEVYLVHDRQAGADESSQWVPMHTKGVAQVWGMVVADCPGATFDGTAFSQDVTGGESTATTRIMMTGGAGLIPDTDYAGLYVAVNVGSASIVEASVAQPQVFLGEFKANKFYFSPFDLFSLPGNTLGSAPGATDPDMKIPFKPGGVRAYQSDSEECGGG